MFDKRLLHSSDVGCRPSTRCAQIYLSTEHVSMRNDYKKCNDEMHKCNYFKKHLRLYIFLAEHNLSLLGG